MLRNAKMRVKVKARDSKKEREDLIKQRSAKRRRETVISLEIESRPSRYRTHPPLPSVEARILHVRDALPLR